VRVGDICVCAQRRARASTGVRVCASVCASVCAREGACVKKCGV